MDESFNLEILERTGQTDDVVIDKASTNQGGDGSEIKTNGANFDAIMIFLFSVLLPTLDVYSDIELIRKAYKAHVEKGNSLVFAVGLTLPLLLHFAFVITKWFQTEKKEHKCWSWFFLALQCWPQLKALQVAWLIHKDEEQGRNEIEKLKKDVLCMKPFLDTWWRLIAMTNILLYDYHRDPQNYVLWVFYGYVHPENGLSENYESYISKGFNGTGGERLFYLKFGYKILSISLNITQFLRIGPFPVLSQDGPLGGMLKLRFIMAYLVVTFSTFAKITFSSLTVYTFWYVIRAYNEFEKEKKKWVIAESSIGNISTLVAFVPNLILANICIAMAKRNICRWAKMHLNNPAVFVLPAACNFVIDPNQTNFPSDGHTKGKPSYNFKKWTILNILLQVTTYTVWTVITYKYLVLADRKWMEEAVGKPLNINFILYASITILCLTNMGVLFTAAFLMMKEKDSLNHLETLVERLLNNGKSLIIKARQKVAGKKISDLIPKVAEHEKELKEARKDITDKVTDKMDDDSAVTEEEKPLAEAVEHKESVLQETPTKSTEYKDELKETEEQAAESVYESEMKTDEKQSALVSEDKPEYEEKTDKESMPK